MGELDRDVSAFGQAALQHGPALVEKVRRFQVSRAAVTEFASSDGARHAGAGIPDAHAQPDLARWHSSSRRSAKTGRAWLRAGIRKRWQAFCMPSGCVPIMFAASRGTGWPCWSPCSHARGRGPCHICSWNRLKVRPSHPESRPCTDFLSPNARHTCDLARAELGKNPEE